MTTLLPKARAGVTWLELFNILVRLQLLKKRRPRGRARVPLRELTPSSLSSFPPRGFFLQPSTITFLKSSKGGKPAVVEEENVLLWIFLFSLKSFSRSKTVSSGSLVPGRNATDDTFLISFRALRIGVCLATGGHVPFLSIRFSLASAWGLGSRLEARGPSRWWQMTGREALSGLKHTRARASGSELFHCFYYSSCWDERSGRQRWRRWWERGLRSGRALLPEPGTSSLYVPLRWTRRAPVGCAPVRTEPFPVRAAGRPGRSAGAPGAPPRPPERSPPADQSPGEARARRSAGCTRVRAAPEPAPRPAPPPPPPAGALQGAQPPRARRR